MQCRTAGKLLSSLRATLPSLATQWRGNILLHGTVRLKPLPFPAVAQHRYCCERTALLVQPCMGLFDKVRIQKAPRTNAARRSAFQRKRFPAHFRRSPRPGSQSAAGSNGFMASRPAQSPRLRLPLRLVPSLRCPLLQSQLHLHRRFPFPQPQCLQHRLGVCRHRTSASVGIRDRSGQCHGSTKPNTSAARHHSPRQGASAGSACCLIG